MAFEQQRTERKRLGGGPVDAGTGFDRSAAVHQEALQGPVQMRAGRDSRDLPSDVLERSDLDACRAAARILGVARGGVTRPVAVEPIRLVGPIALSGFELGI